MLAVHPSALVLVLIETSWNVKVYAGMIRWNGRKVLIETSWNVKEVGLFKRFVNWFVLIETSWNVKCECISFFYLIHSINRNIVECKVLKVYTTYIRILRINRNIVECKAHKQHFTVYFCIVIIEILWNVKYVK